MSPVRVLPAETAAETMDRLWDHFLDMARYRRTDGEGITDARMAIEAAIRRHVVDPRRIAEALVQTDDDSHGLLDDVDGHEDVDLGESFVIDVMPRARAMAQLLVVADLNARHARSAPEVTNFTTVTIGGTIGDRCRPVEGYHASPHVGCVLR